MIRVLLITQTFIGNNLALIRNMNFTDTDYLIKEKYHKKLKTLIKEYGNERYLDIHFYRCLMLPVTTFLVFLHTHLFC